MKKTKEDALSQTLVCVKSSPVSGGLPPFVEIHFNAAFFGQFVEPVLKGEHDVTTDGEGIDLHQARSAVCDNLSMNFLWLNI